MDMSFLVVVAVALGLVSVMIGLRLAASGASSRRVALMIAEVWMVVAAWIGLFGWLSAAMGTPAGAGGPIEVRALPARFAHLSAASRAAAAVGLVVCIGLIAHLMRAVGRLSGEPLGS
jgi:hypothetical protein